MISEHVKISAGQIVKFGIRLTAGQLSEINRIFKYLFLPLEGAIFWGQKRYCDYS